MKGKILEAKSDIFFERGWLVVVGYSPSLV